MKSFNELVIEKQKELIKENLQDIRKNLNNSDYQLKVSNYAEKHGFSVDDLNAQIKENDIVASFFAKDPSKQNFTEKLAAKILNTTTLPQSGARCVRFNASGDIVNKSRGDVSKAADFLIDDVYYTQKYTRGTGGAQDNQYHDVVSFLVKGSKKYKVGAIVDGEYWDNEKREELKKLFHDNNNVVICKVDDLR